MKLTDAEVASALRVLPTGEGQASTLFARVSTDTREDLRDCLFVALKGERYDGHAFVADAVAKGAAGVVIADGEAPSSVLAYRVADTLEALGALGLAARRKLGAKVGALTGSFGKTTTKEFAAALLAFAGERFLATKGNLNNLVGMPKTLLSAEGGERYAVLELGISVPGEMELLSRWCEPDVALVTGVGAAHTEGLGDVPGVAREKLKIAAALKAGGTLVLPHGDALLKAPAGSGAKVVTFGWEEGATVRGEGFEPMGVAGSRFTVAGREFRVGLPGRHNATNALGALALVSALGVELPAGAVPVLKAQSGLRGEVRRTGSGANLLVDCYNANPGAVLAALETLAELAGVARKILVLGEMKELGALSEGSHREVGSRAAKMGVSALFAFGGGAAPAVEAAKSEGLSDAALIGSREELTEILRSQAVSGDWILIKGSRSTRLDEVADALAGRSAES